jgi:hypothetical protein
VDEAQSEWRCDAPERDGTLVAATPDTSLAPSPRQHAGPWASPVFCGDILQGAVIQRQIRHDLLELLVLFFQLPPPAQLTDF